MIKNQRSLRKSSVHIVLYFHGGEKVIERQIEEEIDRVEREYSFDLPEREISREEVAIAIEHTNLKAFAVPEDIERLVSEALEHEFYGVCVNPSYVPMVKEMVKDKELKVITVVGFPLGATSTEAKVSEAIWAVKNGADEIDMVLHVGMLKAQNWKYVYEDIKAVVEASKVPVKVIIETAYLTKEEKIAACVISRIAGAEFVKTSTGFAPSGASPEDVHLMKFVVGENMGVKAAGGIRTFEDASKMLRAGACRIGTSSGVKIIGEVGG